MKVLGEMTKGTREFDAAVARAAAARIAEYAAKTPASFEAREDDPKSEARPLIWAQFDDFTALAGEMEALATNYSGSIETREDVQEALMALGKTCTACHKPYRE
jgi:cytochrome c556